MRNPEATKRHRNESAKRNPRRPYFKKWRAANAEKVSAYKKKWAQANKPKVLAKTRRRQAGQLQATPGWLTQEHFAQMERLYEIANQTSEMSGEKHQVDHIVPLRGRSVCGLHVPWNLRVIPVFLNQGKGNRHWPDMP